MNKKMPTRKCMGCNQIKEKRELIRVVRTSENNVEVDLTGKKNGRGAYVCKSIDCVNKLEKSKRLEKVLECKISDELYESLRGVIIDK